MKLTAITNFLMGLIKYPGDGLHQRAIRSGVLVSALKGLDRLLYIVKLVILARFLTPSDFGLMGIVSLTISSVEAFSQTGFQQALIQKQGNIEQYLDVAWTFLLIRNFAIFILLFVSADYIAVFFNTVAAATLIRACSLSLVFGGYAGIGGLANIGIIYFQKELEFNKQFIYQLTGILADFTVSIVTVFIFKNAWALASGLLAGTIVRCFIGYVIHSHRPHFNLDVSKVKELLQFGKWILLSNIFNFLSIQGDSILVGKLLGPGALGMYQMAYKFATLPVLEITSVISQVTFPAFSKLQQNLSKLQNAYFKVLNVIALFAFLVAGLILLCGEDFIFLFLGEQWLAMLPIMQLLVCASLMRAIAGTAGNLFLALGKPNLEAKGQIMRLFTLFIFIYPLARYFGIYGIALAVCTSVLIITIDFMYGLIKLTKWSINSFIKILILPFISLTVMTLAMNYMTKCHVYNRNLLNFFALTISACVIYCIPVFVYLSVTALYAKWQPEKIA